MKTVGMTNLKARIQKVPTKSMSWVKLSLGSENPLGESSSAPVPREHKKRHNRIHRRYDLSRSETRRMITHAGECRSTPRLGDYSKSLWRVTFLEMWTHLCHRHRVQGTKPPPLKVVLAEIRHLRIRFLTDVSVVAKRN